MGRKKLEYESPVDKLVNFFKDERTKFALGLGMMLLTVIALLGFVSYLFTWKEDQSKFEIGIFRFLFNSDVEVANSGSKIGALLAHIFIHNLRSYLHTQPLWRACICVSVDFCARRAQSVQI